LLQPHKVEETQRLQQAHPIGLRIQSEAGKIVGHARMDAKHQRPLIMIGHLCPAGNTGNIFMYPFSRPQLNAVGHFFTAAWRALKMDMPTA
jgi:hypothetical protein